MMTASYRMTCRKQKGFTLLELMISILVLMIVMGAVFSQVTNIQKTAKTSSMKLDLTQESREFVDQFSRDIHMSGYPISRLYQTGWDNTSQYVATGIVKASPTQLLFEGDVYGDGHVYSVSYVYVASDTNDPQCPCIRRGVVQKVAGSPLPANPDGGAQATPIYYTEVQGVIDPTNLSQKVFTYFDANGNPIDVGTGVTIASAPATVQLIDAIKVNLNVRTQQVDMQTGQQVVHSIASIAELEN